MITVGNNLKRFRNESNLTQEQLSEMAGISISHCANIERGTKAVSITSLCSLADSLGVSTDYLLYEDCSSARIRNIERLLHDQPDDVILKVERMVRVILDDYIDAKHSNLSYTTVTQKEDV